MNYIRISPIVVTYLTKKGYFSKIWRSRYNSANSNRWAKLLRQKGIIVSKKDRPQTYVLLNERGNKLARNRPHLVSTIEKFNIKHDYVNAIPASNTSTHANLMIDNQHKNPTLEDVYRKKFGLTVKKPKRYIDEMWHDLFLTFLQYVNEM